MTPRLATAAVLAVLHSGGGYPDLCRAGRYGTPIWHAVLTVCRVCGSADGCDCARQAADAAALLAHDPIVLSTPAALVAAGTTLTGASA